MEKTEDPRFSTSSGAPSISNLRSALNPRALKEKLAPGLKQALDLLRIQGLDGLENHFLGTEAFLKPWSHHRDSFLLWQPGGEPRASEGGKIKGIDILWFYTNFNEGELRYDPRADGNTALFTPDQSKYGKFDTTHWGVEEHEKMLYAWLLQEFCVGKARNPFGFRFFELQNICKAWRVIFVPVVNAVRESYDPRGRRYYGRLAKFIEDRHPSRVAFPEGNVTMPQSANPYRLVSYPRGEDGVVASAPSTVTSSQQKVEAPVTRREVAALERELRDIYEKYGGIVEKPKNHKKVLADYFAAQKAKLNRKKHDNQGPKSPVFGKRSRNARESPMMMCRGLDTPRTSAERRRSGGSMGSRSSRQSSLVFETPTKSGKKEHKDKKVPFGMFGIMPSPTKTKPEPKSPLHGVTRPLQFPVIPESEDVNGLLRDWKVSGVDNSGLYESSSPRRRFRQPLTQPSQKKEKESDVDNSDLYEAPSPPQPALTRPIQQMNDSDGVHSSIRNSNPFAEDDVSVPMVPPSAIPKPAFVTTERNRILKSVEETPSPPPINESASSLPSYAGTGYERDITPGFIAHKMHAMLEHNAYQSGAYDSPLSDMSALRHPLERGYRQQSDDDEARYFDTPQHIPWPGQTPTALSPEPLPWPGQTPTASSPPMTAWPRDVDSSPPPIPPKYPARSASFRSSSGSEQLQRPPPLKVLGPRIISKENIRGHLRDISREVSEDSLQSVTQHEATSTTPPQRLVTYNSHVSA